LADGFGLREKLDARISAARRSLFYPALIRAIGPAAIWLAGFTIFWLSGLYGRMPLEAQATAGVIFWVGMAVAVLIGLRVWKGPTEDDARDLIDSAIEGRPLSVWTDRPARTDAYSWKLWQAHRDRMAALAAKSGRLDVAPHWRQADPLWLRAVVPVAVIITVVIAGANTPDRMYKGLFPDFGALFGAHKLTVEAWITPPEYTGSAPFILTPGEVAKVPEHSEITLRVIGPGRPEIRILPDGAADATLHPRAGVDGAYEAKVEVDRPMRVAVNFWGERASFPFTVIDDTLPTVSFVAPPKLGEGDHTEFKYKVADDYGVEKLELVARFADPPKGAEKIEETIPVETIALSPKEEEGEFSEDLVRHRWAGLDVMVKLRATDASGAFGESAEVAYHLPEKIFLQPMARAVQEERATLLREWRPYTMPEGEDDFTAVKGRGYNAFATAAASRLRYAPEGVKRTVMMIDALTWKAEDYFEDPIIFMGLRNARSIIDAARDKTEAESSEALLWDIALRAEYGSLSDATAALEAARRALEDALRRGASEEEIKRLMDMYEQAIENYLAAQMADAIRNGRMSQGDGQQPQGQAGGMQMSDDELTRMLQALRDLAETGARDQARQLLNDMQKLLDRMQNMQIQMGRGGQGGQQPDGPMNRALNRALQETNRALNDQRDLNDQTEQAQRDGQQGNAQRGQQLADQQRALRERLEQQMRSGGGQPGQQEQGQGQQGQGQQGQQGQGQQQGQNGQGQPGQQGQQGQGQQGQGQQGNQPGQQPGQGGPNGQGQQNADRGGPGGAPGRPGVRGDGRYGQENQRSRQLLGNAIEMQRRAEEALRRGDFQAAREAQQQAMSALQDRSSELARLNDENDPDAKEARDERDILGRLSNGDSGYGDTVKIPEEMERQKARDILNEIRRRRGDRTLSTEELDYLGRLLERF